MKKVSILLFVVILLSLTACQQESSSDTDISNMTIELVIGISGIDDKSFNQNAWDAIQTFAKENNIPNTNYSFRHSMKEEDFITNLSISADKKPDIIVAPGYYFSDPIVTISEKYPKQKFILLDAKSEIPNVASVTFAANEGSFIAGIAAGLKADAENQNVVGFLGGLDIPLIQEFQAGYTYGVHSINPDIKVIAKYATGFANPVAGQKLANGLFNEGAYVIFNAAGDTGNGLIKEAKERAKNKEDVWVIGVDKDQYNDGIYEDKKSVILTSMLKRVDVATYDMLNKVLDGTFTGMHTLYSLENNGIGLPKQNPNLTDEWIKTIQAYREKVISGEIIVPNSLDALD